MNKKPTMVAHWLRLRLHQCSEDGVITKQILTCFDEQITRYLDNFQQVTEPLQSFLCISGFASISTILSCLSLSQMCFHVFVPVPFAYAQLLKILLMAYTLFIPIGVVATFGWFTPLVSYFNALVVFSVDYVG